MTPNPVFDFLSRKEIDFFTLLLWVQLRDSGLVNDIASGHPLFLTVEGIYDEFDRLFPETGGRVPYPPFLVERALKHGGQLVATGRPSGVEPRAELTSVDWADRRIGNIAGHPRLAVGVNAIGGADAPQVAFFTDLLFIRESAFDAFPPLATLAPPSNGGSPSEVRSRPRAPAATGEGAGRLNKKAFVTDPANESIGRAQLLAHGNSAPSEREVCEELARMCGAVGFGTGNWKSIASLRRTHRRSARGE